mmetsp:Transcript_27939/g.75484  ORF Transcript_27939/g.75484 Transcript_27939/m.75484 type:complete len:564 (-) Transcript_27939:105-1796(-)
MLATQADAGMMELSLPIHWAQLPLITSQSCPQISDAHVSSGTRVVLCSVMLEERRRGSLVPVVSRLEGASSGDVHIGGLLGGELGELGAQAGQVQHGHLLVQVLGQHVHLTFVAAGGALVPQLQLGNHLVGEGAGHDERGVASGAAQVEQAALSQDDHTMAVGEDEAVTLGLDVLALDAGPLEHTSHVDLVIEVADVAHDGVVLHLGHVVGHDDVLVAGGGDEDVGGLQHILQGSDLVALHGGLQGADGVNLRHHHAGTASLQGASATLAHITVASHECGLAGNHDVSGAHDAIGQRVTAAIHVVKLGLGDGVVDVDGGEQQAAHLLHLIQPLHTGGGLLRHTHDVLGHAGPAGGVLGQAIPNDAQHNLELSVGGGVWVGQDLVVLGVSGLGLDTLVDEEGSITTIIHQQVGAVTLRPHQGLVGAPPVLLQSLPLPGKHCRGVARNGGGGVVLGAEDVAGAPADLGTQGSQGLNQHGSLDGHVEGAHDLGALQGLGGAELRAAGHQAGHLSLSQVDLQAAEVRLSDVLDLVLAPSGSGINARHHAHGGCGVMPKEEDHWRKMK